MKKLLVIAAGVGYLFGTKSGREHYEQMRRKLGQMKEDHGGDAMRPSASRWG